MTAGPVTGRLLLPHTDAAVAAQAVAVTVAMTIVVAVLARSEPSPVTVTVDVGVVLLGLMGSARCSDLPRQPCDSPLARLAACDGRKRRSERCRFSTIVNWAVPVHIGHSATWSATRLARRSSSSPSTWASRNRRNRM